MRNKYLLYPEACEQLQEAGLPEKTDALIEKNEDTYLGGFIYEDSVVGAVKTMLKKNMYKHFEKKMFEKWKDRMEKMFTNKEVYSREVSKDDTSYNIPLDVEDFLLFCGDYASLVINPDDVADYKKFGFSSPATYLTTTGAYLKNRLGSAYSEKGYKWTSRTRKGEEIINTISGDIHSDLRITQQNASPYKTTDPFGNNISIRPISQQDKSLVSAYHSVEPQLLVTILKYIDQKHLNVANRQKKIGELIDRGRSLNSRSIKTAEGFGDAHPLDFFRKYNFDIPLVKENELPEGSSVYTLATEHGNPYYAYIADDGDLLLVYSNMDGTRQECARYTPEDVIDLIKGLLYQSVNHLGRTSVQQLIDILTYRHSDSFKSEVLDA